MVKSNPHHVGSMKIRMWETIGNDCEKVSFVVLRNVDRIIHVIPIIDSTSIIKNRILCVHQLYVYLVSSKILENNLATLDQDVRVVYERISFYIKFIHNLKYLFIKCALYLQPKENSDGNCDRECRIHCLGN